MTKAIRTRNLIIHKTAPIFNQRGYAGTSLSDLEGATGLSKGALYGNFHNKEDIALAAFEYSMDKVRESVSSHLVKNGSTKGKLISLLTFYAQYVFNPPIPGGCPLINSAVEADDNHAFIRSAVAREIKRAITYIANLIEQGKKNGEFKPSTEAHRVAVVMFCSIEGAIVVSRVSSSDLPMKAVVSHCKSILEQISL